MMRRRDFLHHTITVAAGWLAGVSYAGAAPGARPASTPKTRPAEISFTLHKLLENNVEGPDVERTYFMGGGRRIVIGVPKECRLTAGDGFLLGPLESDGFDGEIRVTRSAFPTELNLAENALKYRDAATNSLPAGLNHAQVSEPILNPYPYNGWKSLGFTWNYALYGRPMVRTVSYINLEIGAQIVVTTVAGKKDAEKVEKLAKQFLGSWWIK